jgi:hypothetical protein
MTLTGIEPATYKVGSGLFNEAVSTAQAVGMEWVGWIMMNYHCKRIWNEVFAGTKLELE